MDVETLQDDDAMSLPPGGTQDDFDLQNQPPPVATPEQINDHEAAAAAAEVAAQREQNDPEQTDQYEAVDENGELVRQAFLQFLQE